jgi:hypothetical protein
MSGPIVRTGTTPKFWENFDQAFGKKKAAAAPAKAAAKVTKKATKKAAAKKATKKK